MFITAKQLIFSFKCKHLIMCYRFVRGTCHSIFLNKLMYFKLKSQCKFDINTLNTFIHQLSKLMSKILPEYLFQTFS